MKRVSLVVGWLLFALGLPAALVLGHFRPDASVIRAISNLLDGNREMFFLYLASVLLWLIWLSGLFTFIYDLWQLKLHNTTPKVSFSFRRWITVCATAVWSLLIASRVSESTNTSMPIDITLDDSEYAKSKFEADPLQLPSPMPLALCASTMVVAGVLELVQQRRKRVLQHSAPHSQVQILSRRSQSTLTELQLATAASNRDGIRAAMITLMESDPAPTLAAWRPNSQPRAVLHHGQRPSQSQPLCCVPLGLAQGEILLLTLSRGDEISVITDGYGSARSVLVHLANSIVIETVNLNTAVIACGFLDAELINAPHLVTMNSMEHLLEQVLSTDISHPTIVCSAHPLSVDAFDRLRDLGCAIVAASIDGDPDVVIRHTAHGWSIFPTQQLVSLYGISTEESTAIKRLVEEASRPATISMVVEKPEYLPEWKVIVRVLGPVEVMTRDGLPIRFEKSKSLELMAWLTTHRSRPTRSAARTALWEVNVQDATFTNVVSDARRSLGKVVPLTMSEEWLPRTLTDALPLHISVTTDGALLDASIQRASVLGGDEALTTLRDGLDYVRNLPFSGTNYLWPDAEGITTQLTLSVMTSAVMAAELYLERGDVEGVFWATGRGLKVLPGHEELLALRMRAHALKGDLAAVRAEWSSHQRAIARDTWSGGATSPKLNELCRELMQPQRHGVHSVTE